MHKIEWMDDYESLIKQDQKTRLKHVQVRLSTKQWNKVVKCANRTKTTPREVLEAFLEQDIKEYL